MKLTEIVKQLLDKHNVLYSERVCAGASSNQGYVYYDFYLPRYNIALICEKDTSNYATKQRVLNDKIECAINAGMRAIYIPKSAAKSLQNLNLEIYTSSFWTEDNHHADYIYQPQARCESPGTYVDGKYWFCGIPCGLYNIHIGPEIYNKLKLHKKKLLVYAGIKYSAHYGRNYSQNRLDFLEHLCYSNELDYRTAKILYQELIDEGDIPLLPDTDNIDWGALGMQSEYEKACEWS